MKVYLVGGAVRDKRLGLPILERDWVVVGATPEEMMAKGFKPVGKDFPVFLHPITHEQYALARTERKVRRGYQGFQFNTSPEVTLADDLKRRDLTINAMAETSDGELIDLFGGARDLKARVLRHISPSFVEDPVRVLRVARFAARFHALGFRVAPSTLLLMKKMVHSGEVDALVPERVWQEFETALKEPNPEQFILVLRASKALPRIFPELEALVQGEGMALQFLKQAAALTSDPVVRFAALVFQVFHFERCAKRTLHSFCRRICAPRLYSDLALLTARHYFSYAALAEVDAERILEILEKLDAFRRPERFFQFLTVCQAIDAVIKTPKKLVQAARILHAAFRAASAITARQVKDKTLSGKTLGEAIHHLRLETIREILNPKS